MSTATIIHDKNEKGQGYFFECPLNEISIDPVHKVVSIFMGNGHWDQYNLIDYDRLDNGDIYTTVGALIRTIYISPITINNPMETENNK